MNQRTNAALLALWMLPLVQSVQAQKTQWVHDSAISDTLTTYLTSRATSNPDLLGEWPVQKLIAACNTRDKVRRFFFNTVLPVAPGPSQGRLSEVKVSTRLDQAEREYETWLTAGSGDVIWRNIEDTEQRPERWKTAKYVILLVPLRGGIKKGGFIYLDGLKYELNWLAERCS